MSKIGRNAKCPCGSGIKHKKCCLNKPKSKPNKTTYRYVKMSDFGTSTPAIARLGLGLMELVDLTSLSIKSGDFIKERGLKIAQILAEANKISEPITNEINSIITSISRAGVNVDEKGKPYISEKCKNLEASRDFIVLCNKAMPLFFECINHLWNTNIAPQDTDQLKRTTIGKFGDKHVLSRLIADDIGWINDLNSMVRLTEKSFSKEVTDFVVLEGWPDGKFLVTLPMFSNGLQIGNYLEVLNHNILTFIEEILVFSLAEFLDPRLTINDLPEQIRESSAPVRFRVGVWPDVDISVFKDDPKLSKIYRSGQHAYHLKEKIREQKFGRIRPIIHSEYQGKKMVVVGSVMHMGTWVTFIDFLFDFLKIKFGKDWWLAEAAKDIDSCSLVMKWSQESYRFQKENSVEQDGLYSIDPNGPMHAQLMLAYDLFVLEDNQMLQSSLIERMKQSDRTNFWGARYEATVAAIFLKAGFDIEYEDETDGDDSHPEFVAAHRITGERIAVEAKKRNRQENAEETQVKLKITRLINRAIKKFKGIPYMLFVELDLPPIEGNTLEQPWIKELMKSLQRSDNRDSEGKDVFNSIVFTNYPTEHPEEEKKYPAKSHIVSESLVPKIPLKNSIHLVEIRAILEKAAKIPSWFEE